MQRKILLIDDEPDIIELIPMLDKNTDRVYEFCLNPETALERISSEEFAIVVCDISMPKLDGVKFAQKVRELNIKTPIIFFTGYLIEDIEEKVRGVENCSIFSKTNIKNLTAFLSEKLAAI